MKTVIKEKTGFQVNEDQRQEEPQQEATTLCLSKCLNENGNNKKSGKEETLHINYLEETKSTSSN